jgi:hypothetical protein
MQMRREAEHEPPRPSRPLSPGQRQTVEAKRPSLGGDNDRDDELAATSDWLAHIARARA